MKNIEQDINEHVWGIETFQKCVPEKYRTNVAMLVGKYYATHPSESTVSKIITIVEGCDKTRYNTLEKQLRFVQEEL